MKNLSIKKHILLFHIMNVTMIHIYHKIKEISLKEIISQYEIISLKELYTLISLK